MMMKTAKETCAQFSSPAAPLKQHCHLGDAVISIPGRFGQEEKEPRTDSPGE